MINYPLYPPTNEKTTESSFSLIAANVVGVNQSPYTFNSQIYDYNSETWGLKVSINPLTRAEAQPWIAFLTALRGRRGTFMFGPVIMGEPLGTGSGVPVVASANQTGRELLTSGWAYSQLVLQKGDLMQIDQSLYMVLSDVTSGAEGLATIDVFPQLRIHANQAQIILSAPKGIFRLTSNTVPVLDVSETGLFNINFEAEEAL
jgi:hypothetical protein